MDEIKAQEAVQEAPQMVNCGVGPAKYQFLRSILSDGADGAMSRIELFRKCQRLDAILTASPEQIKGMKVEIVELKQVVNLCQARFSEVMIEAEKHIGKIEEFIALNISNPSSDAPYKVLSKNLSRLKHKIAGTDHKNQVAMLRALTSKLVRLAPGAVLEGKDVAKLIPLLQKLNSDTKHTRHKVDELGVIIGDLSV